MLLQNYEYLFYLLQTNPEYFARLIFELPQTKTTKFMDNVVLTVFNYATNAREQYLLVKLFEAALREEIYSKVDKISDVVTGNPLVIRLVVQFTRYVRDPYLPFPTSIPSLNISHLPPPPLPSPPPPPRRQEGQQPPPGPAGPCGAGGDG